MDSNFENLREIVHQPGTFYSFSTYYALGNTYSNIAYYLGWIVWTMGCRQSLLYVQRVSSSDCKQGAVLQVIYQQRPKLTQKRRKF